MERAVLSRWCAAAFLPFELHALLEVLPLKRILSPSHSMLVLLALASAHCLSAQSLVIDKSSLTFSGQFGGPVVTQTVNVTSSTGASTAFLLAAPGLPWLKFNGQSSVTGSTPSAVTVTADPTGLAAGTYTGSITVAGGTPLILSFR